MNLANTRQQTMSKFVVPLLLIVDVIIFLSYFPLNHPWGPVSNFHSRIDDYIPLVTSFIWIYLSYFVFLLLTCIYFISKVPKLVTINLLLSIGIACLIAYATYWYWQGSVDRPLLVTQDISDELYMWVTKNVAPYNAFPSLHVAISLICLAGYKQIKSRYYKFILIWVILIIASTLFTKQHYFLDVIGGGVLSVGSLYIAAFIMKKVHSLTTTP